MERIWIHNGIVVLPVRVSEHNHDNHKGNPMTQIPAAEAVTQFDKLLKEAAQGEEVIIIGADGSAFKLVALSRKPKPVFGSARGLIHIGPDFDDPIPGFEDYVP